MAYLDLSDPITAATSPRARAVAIAPSFNPCEWAVVNLARHDNPSSLFEPGRVRRFIEKLFDVRRSNGLADPRLEALRRMAVLLRSGLARLAPEEIARFVAAGFSHTQLTALAQHVAGAKR